MEAQWLAEYPHQGADKRPRKRPRLAWDVAPTVFQPPKAIPMLYCGQELINGNFATAFVPPPPIYYTGPPRNLSPPWRPDDKDGHYVFAVGENLTPRCIFPPLNDILFTLLALVACFWFGSLTYSLFR